MCWRNQVSPRYARNPPTSPRFSPPRIRMASSRSVRVTRNLLHFGSRWRTRTSSRARNRLIPESRSSRGARGPLNPLALSTAHRQRHRPPPYTYSRHLAVTRQLKRDRGESHCRLRRARGRGSADTISCNRSCMTATRKKRAVVVEQPPWTLPRSRAQR